MKKIFLVLFVIIGCTITVNAQQTVVLQNQQTSTEQTTDPNIFYINGIPSTQDIGGVEALYEVVDYRSYLFLKNYNSSMVTVLYQYEDTYNDIFTGSVVLQSNESKRIRTYYNRVIIKIATITRKL